eukprot:GHVN01086708.1.p1 GENE.GHVN01086708.1~~GHVN01086708.1.p1  ORF type:complete len:128 (-),score=38.30 GHVN01086708.1:285-668(-)
MKAVLRALGFEVKRDDVRRMFNEVGKEVSEPILFQEFCKLMDGRMPDKNSPEEIEKMFLLFDEDGTGSISIKNLKRIAHEIAEPVTDEELEQMIREADRNGDGVIDRDEFFRVISYQGDGLADDDDD